MKKENIERDYKETLDIKFIERVGSPFKWGMPILGTNKVVQPIKNKKILVIRLEGIAELYAINNTVTYITDNKEKFEKFLNKVNDDKYGSDDSAILIDYCNWKNIDKLMENRKFDICIMNPPYDGSLHLKILEKVLNFCDKVVNISPSNCYTCNRLKFSTDIAGYSKFVKSVFSHCVELFKYSGIEASTLFDIAQGTDISIQLYNSNYVDLSYTPDKFINYNDKILEKSICNKILGKCKESHWQTYLGDGDFKLNTSHVHGHVNCKDFTNLLCLTYEDALKVKKTPDGRSCQFSFRTDLERKNFYTCYMNSKVIHYWNLQWKNQIILVLKYIPYFTDYTQPWTDERLCKYFGITGYVDDNTAEPCSEWEIILNTVK